MAIIVDGNKIAASILTGLKARVEKLKKNKVKPALAVVIVGNDKPSHTYVKKKGESALQIGVDFFKFELPDNTDKETLITRIREIQKEHDLSGLIVQLPLPEKLSADTRKIVNGINSEIDVDCLTYGALGRVLMGQSDLFPPTPGAILEILKYHQIDLTGKEVCLVGRGELIGKPLAAILQNYPVTLTVCGRSTKDLSVYTKRADIVICGVGKKDLLTGEMIKEGAVVIDAGVCFVDGKMYGDINFESVSKKASLVVPTPGGVGPITVAKLLENTVKVAELRINN
ncbi:MAG: bifunctional methylenetetrahydrofolate dehydrogenase/methenyltetrahydrofolate cyclohydrolase [Candidatus Komeilibacteria bacterium]|nr:bifunctional methylenetetrahydrofolate dehydrogenase/methenyltetrahydrofolate cyclohydrolase [Candidatus Komeilibacteria bacterium]